MKQKELRNVHSARSAILKIETSGLLPLLITPISFASLVDVRPYLRGAIVYCNMLGADVKGAKDRGVVPGSKSRGG